MSAEIFQRCHTYLSAFASGGSRENPKGSTSLPANDPQAALLLRQLGYLPRDNAGPAPDDAAPESGWLQNRLALLRLASKLERFIRLPSRQAPGAFFLGSELAPGKFGLSSPDGALISASGRGLSLSAAFEGCIGEAAEYLSFLEWGHEERCKAPIPQENVGSPEARCDGPGGTLEWLLKGIGSDRRRLGHQPIEWITLDRFDKAAGLSVPLDLCLRRSNAPFRKAESSGCAAGPSLEAAQYVALMELIERDAIALWWYGGVPAAALKLADLESRRLTAFSRALRPQSARRSWLLDISNDTGIPVVAAISSSSEGGNVVCGFAADLDPTTAAQKALLELCQMELAEDIVGLRIKEQGVEGLSEADQRVLKRLSRIHIDRHPQLSRRRPPSDQSSCPPSSIGDKLNSSLETLKNCGFDAYWIDLTRAEFGVPVARVLVPELQSIDVSWETDRLLRASTTYNFNAEEYQDLPPII